jgi:hypothetical protein
MIRDVIDRFRYRFHLWWKEQREDLSWRRGPEISDLRDPAVWENPKYEILWTESTPSFIIREASLYVAIILLLSNIGFLIDRFFPSARHAVGVAFLSLVSLWTVLSVLMVIDMVKKRKAYRVKNAKSSNQSLQLTAARRDNQVSIHEPPYTPSIPPFRQR